MSVLFKSASAKKEILDLYDKKLDELNIEYEYRLLESSFGKTNIIVTGDARNPPLIIIHGANGCAPISLETYPNLSTQYQVFAVDVLHLDRTINIANQTELVNQLNSLAPFHQK